MMVESSTTVRVVLFNGHTVDFLFREYTSIRRGMHVDGGVVMLRPYSSTLPLDVEVAQYENVIRYIPNSDADQFILKIGYLDEFTVYLQNKFSFWVNQKYERVFPLPQSPSPTSRASDNIILPCGYTGQL